MPGVCKANERLSSHTVALLRAIDQPGVIVSAFRDVRRSPAQHEPDRGRRVAAGIEQAVGRRRVEADRVARLEEELVEADPDGQRAAEDVAPFLAGMTLECVR